MIGKYLSYFQCQQYANEDMTRREKEAAHGGSAIPWQPAGPGEQAQPWIQSVKNQFNILDLLCRPYQILS